MAGLPGNRSWLMFQKQSAKGTPATVATANAYKVPFTGGNINVQRAIDQLAETDANRDQGLSYVRSVGAEGTPECYVRDSSIGALLYYVLGSSIASGSTNFTHTITPANTLPYVTFWKAIGGTLYEQYQDCMVNSLTIRAGAGDPLTASVGVIGLRGDRLAADPSTSPVISLGSSYVYNFNDATVTLSGGATALVSSFELTIENNIGRQQTDSFIPYDLTVGQRTVSLSFDLIFETLSEYNAFHYGSTSGTTINQTIYTTDATFQFDNGANNQVKFALPTIAYEEFPVEPNVSGDPIVSSIRAVGQRPSSGSIITATIKNQVASY